MQIQATSCVVSWSHLWLPKPTQYPAWRANCGSSDCHLQPPSLVPPNCRSPPNHIIRNQNHLHTDNNYTLQKHLNRTLVTLIPQSICFAESILLIFYLSAFATYSLCLYVSDFGLVWSGSVVICSLVGSKGMGAASGSRFFHNLPFRLGTG